jgi:ABC-type transporter Mla maintaining outer membrane lipid asymmetry ATPase subunit MlaF
MDNPPVQSTPPVIQMEAVAVGSMQDVSSAVAEGIHWSVQAGDFWLIAGLQGSGKSDLLMLTAGLMAPLSGRYRLFGEPMPLFGDAHLQARLRVGLVFDGGQLFHHLTVRENIALPLRYHRDLTSAGAEAQVQQMLETMELVPWAESTPGAMGRNWQKRVGLARALMLKPEVLLVDNPLAGLDPRHIHWWLNFLGHLSKGHPLADDRPVTLVVTTSALRLWKHHARQFAVLKDRRLVVLGSWTELESAGDDLVREFLTTEVRADSD